MRNVLSEEIEKAQKNIGIFVNLKDYFGTDTKTI